MKKIFLLAAVGALGLTACQTKTQNFVLTASELPSELNDSYAYVVEDRENVDSVLITDGAFTLTVDSLTPDRISYITLGEAAYVPFIKEAGAFKIIVDTDDEGNPRYTVDGDANSLNNKLTDYTRAKEEISKPIEAMYGEKYQILESNPNLPKDSIALIQKEMEELSNQMITQMNELSKKVYEENKDNLIGIRAFSSIEYEDDADFIAAYEAASDAVKSDKRLQTRYESVKTSLNTQAGADYVDFTMEDGQGNSAKLSDYLNDGRYLLVDFWASWCGPCRRAMPHIASIAKDHAAKIRVLSVGTWEKTIDDNNKAKEELNMTWETFFDSQNAGVAAYGITGIPAIMLISPEGQIVVRTHDPAEIDAKIEELNL